MSVIHFIYSGYGNFYKILYIIKRESDETNNYSCK